MCDRCAVLLCPRTGMLSRPVCNRGGVEPPVHPVAADASPRAGVFSSGVRHRNREWDHLQFCSVSSPKSFTLCKYNMFSDPGRTKEVHLFGVRRQPRSHPLPHGLGLAVQQTSFAAIRARC